MQRIRGGGGVVRTGAGAVYRGRRSGKDVGVLPGACGSKNVS